MSSEAIEKWLADGERNVAGLFSDDDLKSRPGWLAITSDGEHPIYLNVLPPFNIEFPPALCLLDQVLAMTASSIEERLDQICAALVHGDDDQDDSMEEYNEEEYHNPHARAQCVVQQQMRDAAAAFDVGNLNGAAVERILRDLVSLRDVVHDGWSAAPAGRNLALWHVELFGFDAESPLQRDIEAMQASGGAKSIKLAMRFPAEYPFKPPFIRIVNPRFVFRTGRVTVGGSICTQVLTEEGWNPTFNIESLLVSIRAQITDPEANARIDLNNRNDYTEEEALAAFSRVAAQHKRDGW
jgi:ubiquitin-protein ligase